MPSTPPPRLPGSGGPRRGRYGAGRIAVRAADGPVTAVLGPTNTGKTHYAIERMLAHRTGVIGFPLRLLAREVYDRVVALRGPAEAALITGEEKIVPPTARFFLCTVEAMPLDWGADFLAVDEIQLAADLDRGHVFTDRLLRARGKHETLFLGSMIMRDRIAALAPQARFVSRDRMSSLTYAGPKKLSRLPPRSAVVGFSADSVYAIAELLRRQKGGAAVVLGALSPRTRNAQVALYQEGDVDYLVATDAIGMGLNLDVQHVAFAGLAKFDGRRHRRLEAQELAQIAGRAGRHLNDGTFGVTGEASPLDEEMVSAIEGHSFRPVQRLEWRNSRLEFATPQALIASLEADPDSPDLARAREADDLIALRTLAAEPEIAARAKGRSAVTLLWDVCQAPDFRKTMASEHAALLTQLYRFLSSDACVVPDDWMAGQVARVDRTDGDIDALSKRLAYVRSWTYVANRTTWLKDPEHWRGATRAVEDKLSDALHERLTQRFVDRRTSVLARRLKQKESLVAEFQSDGAVTVEGEFVGRLDGFRFRPDPAAAGAEVKTLQAAGAQALAAEVARRVERFYGAPDAEIDVTHQGGLMWGDVAVGRLASRASEGGDPLSLKAIAFVDEGLDPALKDKIERRLQFWIDRKLQAAFEPLFALRDDPAVTGLARGVAFQLLERFGVIPRQEIADDVKALDQAARGLLRKHGVRFGQFTVFVPALLKPAPTRLRMLLWGLAQGLDEIPAPPPPGLVTIPSDSEAPAGFFAMAGYRPAGPRALRLDMLERLANLIRPLDARSGFEATAEMLSITGATLDQFAEIMAGLGYAGERGERPKSARPKPEPPAEATDTPTGETPATDTPTTDTPTGETPTAAGDGPSSANPEAGEVGNAAETQAAEAPPAASTESGPPAEAAPESASEAVETAPMAEEAEEAGAAQPTETAVADGDAPRAEPVEAAEPSAAETADAAPDGPAPNGADGEPPAGDSASTETEVFYIFKFAPRGPRRGRREDGQQPRGRRRGGQEGQQREGGGRRDGQDGQKSGRGRRGGDNVAASGEGGGSRGDRNRKGGKGGDQRAARGQQGGGGGGGKPRREPRVDPDSPFAILQSLKEKT